MLVLGWPCGRWAGHVRLAMLVMDWPVGDGLAMSVMGCACCGGAGCVDESRLCQCRLAMSAVDRPCLAGRVSSWLAMLVMGWPCL